MVHGGTAQNQGNLSQDSRYIYTEFACVSECIYVCMYICMYVYVYMYVYVCCLCMYYLRIFIYRYVYANVVYDR
jgi:hypothetical protein